LTWKTSNMRIATCMWGTIYGMGYGSCTITVTTSEGKSDSITVYVN
jgi:uncharacterized protein YjdB